MGVGYITPKGKKYALKIMDQFGSIITTIKYFVLYTTYRSQPPYLTLMMKEYVDKTADIHFLRSQLPTLVRELEFWEQHRSVLVEREGITHQLFAFGTGGTGKYSSISNNRGVFNKCV